MAGWFAPAVPADTSATELRARVTSIRHVTEREDAVFVIADTDHGTVKGEIERRSDLAIGEHYQFLGAWREHPRWGWAFHFDALLSEVPTDASAVISWLARYASEVGPVTAARLVDAYGPGAVKVLCEDWARVATDGHLTPAQAQAASESLLAVVPDPALRDAQVELFALLRGHGFWRRAQAAALKRWRTRAPAVVRQDPFRLMTAGLPGCGFVRCNGLYTRLGRPLHRLKRQALAGWYALRQAEGDTWLSLEAAFCAIRSQIGNTVLRERRALALLYRAGLVDLHTDTDGRMWLAERSRATAERSIVRSLAALSGEGSWPDILETGLDGHQAEQIAACLGSRVVILTGSPGTGKTYCAAALIRAMVRRIGQDQVAVCAPTGKAAVRITEALHGARLPLEASTIHRLVGIWPDHQGDMLAEAEPPAYGPHKPLPYRLVVVDEVSMMDATLMAQLLAALAPGTHLLLVGDVHQLPPVGHGAPLRDLIAGGVPTARLTEIRRNAGRIVMACKEIKDGLVPDLPRSLADWPQSNLVHLSSGRDRDRLLERLGSLYDWLSAGDAARTDHGQPPWDLIDDVQVLCARNETRRHLNTHLQGRLNAAGTKGPVGAFRTGDKVICLKNGRYVRADTSNPAPEMVANGDIGRVQSFHGRTMFVRLTSPQRVVIVPLGRASADGAAQITGDDVSLSSWDLAYAITTHKSQGSEWPVVILLVELAGRIGCRELVYTGVSRARELCLLVGEQRDLAACVRRVTLPDRKTFLVEMIGEETQ